MGEQKEPVRVLFVCVHNAARSQMAEALANRLGDGRMKAESAGLEPTEINPLAIEAMAEAGMDISGRKTRKVFDLYREGRLFDFVITVCNESQAARCPIFPGITRMIHWDFPDPASFEGTHEERLAKTIEVRDRIEAEIIAWLKNLP